jgi:cytochrome bd-type quinol oxidase subunit 2
LLIERADFSHDLQKSIFFFSLGIICYVVASAGISMYPSLSLSSVSPDLLLMGKQHGAGKKKLKGLTPLL